MPESTNNNGTRFFNNNICRSFNISLTTDLTPLSSQVCSEVLVINKTGGDIELYDSGYTASENALLLNDLDSISLRGLTDANQLSAKMVSGTGTLYYRTQYFSNNPSR